MTLQDYLKTLRRRWLVIAACTLSAAAVMWVITPASSDTTQKVGSYTATATLLVGSAQPDETSISMARIPLYLTTGEVPKRAAEAVGYDGDPALLASELTVTPDYQALAVTVSATASDGRQAAAVANAFAEETVAFFAEKKRPGTGNVRLSVLQEATPIPNQSSRGGFVVPPGRGPRTALAAALGLLAGLALALVLDRLDSRLRTRDEIHAALRMPIIAEVPRLPRSQRARHAVLGAENPLTIYADGYRAARTALMHTTSRQVPGNNNMPVIPAAGGRGGSSGTQLVLVTSAHESEGKTTSVANLAASFAETGQRVLVLDADLRSPDAHNLFDVPQGAGISDYVSDPGETSLDALIRPTSVPGVRIITAGTRLAHPASLASRMGHLLAEARDMADVVIIDTAPLLAASDVFDILPMMDTVLLVVRSGRLTETTGNRVAELLGRFQVPVAGVILVGVHTRSSGGYGYRYGYGYGGGKKKHARKAVRGASSQEQGETTPSASNDGADTANDSGRSDIPNEPEPAVMLSEAEPTEPQTRRARRTSSA